VNAKSRAFTANKVHVAKHQHHVISKTRKPSCRWQTRATRKHAKNAPVRRVYNVVAGNLIFIRLGVVATEIPRNSLNIQTIRVQGHPRSSILVSMESPYVTSY